MTAECQLEWSDVLLKLNSVYYDRVVEYPWVDRSMIIASELGVDVSTIDDTWQIQWM